MSRNCKHNLATLQNGPCPGCFSFQVRRPIQWDKTSERGYLTVNVECHDCCCVSADVDECATRQHKCPSEARCMNDIGSYSCQCGYGYYGEDRMCKGTLTCATWKGSHDIAAVFAGWPTKLVNSQTLSSHGERNHQTVFQKSPSRDHDSPISSFHSWQDTGLTLHCPAYHWSSIRIFLMIAVQLCVPPSQEQHLFLCDVSGQSVLCSCVIPNELSQQSDCRRSGTTKIWVQQSTHGPVDKSFLEDLYQHLPTYECTVHLKCSREFRLILSLRQLAALNLTETVGDGCPLRKLLQ